MEGIWDWLSGPMKAKALKIQLFKNWDQPGMWE